MDIKITETGEMKKLVIIDQTTGTEWTQDLIGNAGALNDGQFTWDEEANAYLADQDTYDWWAKYISDHNQTEDDIEALAEEFDLDAGEIKARVSENTGNDYEDHRSQAVRMLEEIREEHSF